MIFAVCVVDDIAVSVVDDIAVCVVVLMILLSVLL